MKKTFLLSVLLNIFLCSCAGKVDTVYVMSPSMNKLIPNIIITPDNYQKNNEALPVLYLLHGATGDFKSWLSNALGLEDYADQYNMLIVCPDGGYTSWYFDSPVDKSMKYETYISKELVAFVDSKYRTRADKNSRAIAGLSMGGHGALYLAFRHQDVWGACGSMSGGVDIRPFPNNWDIAKRLGTYAEHPDNWEKNTVINLLPLLDGKSLNIIFDCGVDDFFYAVNKKLHQEMLYQRIPHDYIERPGQHDGNYWKNAVKYQLLYFHEFFQQKNMIPLGKEK
ncbi:MAG: esterase family protein [Bacteroidetes bacterium]|nr:esterase family protein [Bacteroidota bacterium]